MLVWLCLAWVFASAMVAMLPMRRQYVPGVMLMLAAPVLIWQIALAVGGWAALGGTIAFVSMYRNPLRYSWKRLTGQVVETPG